MVIRRPKCAYQLESNMWNEAPIIYEREEEEAVKEITMQEIEEKFGCKVKIVKE